jgi:exopolysaccharide biosynthesis operon protein EpsL
MRGAQGHAPLGVRIVAGAIAVAGLFLPAAQAFALWDDRLTLFAEEKATRDDNVFRLSKNAAPEDIGVSTRGDTYRTTSLGLNIDVPVSRQRFQAAFARNDIRYDQLSVLDFTGREGRAMWLWQLGNDASGQLGYTETLALASFANIVAFKNSQITPDPLKTRQALFSAAYLVTPRWRLNAGISGLELRNGDPARQSLDLDVLYSEVALSYVTPANTSVGLSARTEDGRFPKALVDSAYRQTSAGVVADWTPTGASHLSARADRLSRRYADMSLQTFDFVGYTARAQYDWKPTGKLSLAAVAQRDIYPYQDIGSSFVLVKGVTLRPTLRVTEKIDVSGTLDYSIREFLPSPGQTSGSSPSRTDRVRSVAATLSYRPARTLTLLMSAQREGRSSNFVPDATAIPAVLPVDYVVNVFSISARLAF